MSPKDRAAENMHKLEDKVTVYGGKNRGRMD